MSLPLRHISEDPESKAESNISAADVESELGEIELGRQDHDTGKPVLLIIDDNEDIRKMVGELMADEYQTVFAPDGKEGLRLAAKYVPDLIICDVMMPVMDDLECCRRIKEEISTSHIPVLMLTACSMDEQRVQGYESGADGEALTDWLRASIS